MTWFAPPDPRHSWRWRIYLLTILGLAFGLRLLAGRTWSLLPTESAFLTRWGLESAVWPWRTMAALAGMVTVAGVYALGRDLFSPPVGLSAAFLYAILPQALYFERAMGALPCVTALVVWGAWGLWFWGVHPAWRRALWPLLCLSLLWLIFRLESPVFQRSLSLGALSSLFIQTTRFNWGVGVLALGLGVLSTGVFAPHKALALGAAWLSASVPLFFMTSAPSLAGLGPSLPFALLLGVGGWYTAIDHYDIEAIETLQRGVITACLLYALVWGGRFYLTFHDHAPQTEIAVWWDALP